MAKTGGPVVLMVAIVVYSSIITSMGWRAAARIDYSNESRVSQVIALVAALTFMSSDSMIAYNTFYITVPHNDILILLTYW
jgi:uncharacterized membrane protein YhhN